MHNLVLFLKYVKQRFYLYRCVFKCELGNVAFINWWYENPEESWFYKLSKFYTGNKKLVFCSVFGPHKNITNLDSDSNFIVFYSGENLEKFDTIGVHSKYYKKLINNRVKKYGDYCNEYTKLSLGFGNKGFINYLRLPLWVIRYFEPDSSLELISRKLENYKIYKNNFRENAASLLSSHDLGGTRAFVINEINDIVNIVSAGKFYHNTGDFYVDDKNEFLKRYKFNICAENVDAPGYVSEKVFDAIFSGSIPIYLGSKGSVELDILNSDRIIIFKYGEDNSKQKELLRSLVSNEDLYQEFWNRDAFKEGAAISINLMLNMLREKIR